MREGIEDGNSRNLGLFYDSVGESRVALLARISVSYWGDAEIRVV